MCILFVGSLKWENLYYYYYYYYVGPQSISLSCLQGFCENSWDLSLIQTENKKQKKGFNDRSLSLFHTFRIFLK